jgi:hypothetical protein
MPFFFRTVQERHHETESHPATPDSRDGHSRHRSVRSKQIPGMLILWNAQVETRQARKIDRNLISRVTYFIILSPILSLYLSK